MDAVEPAVEITRCLGAPVCRYLQYHRKLNDYMKNFKSIKDKLNAKVKDVEQQPATEPRPWGKIPRNQVENWLKEGRKMITEAESVENKVNNGRYLLRACLAKRVEKKTQEMQDILNKGPNVSEGLVIDGPSVGFPLPTSELTGETVVRDQIWTWLMQEEVLRIGVWGMGGVGKTTIMMNIQNALLNENRFDKVIWVTVSKEFNIVKLQDDIAKALNGDLSTEGDKVRRAALLRNMLENAKNHVLILDDMWDEISLEEVGIPEPTSSNGCKLVLTTRKEEVCKFMGCKVIKVNPLSEEEALTLFLNKVGPNISQIPESTLRDVVKECAGLPLTITVVAGTLKGENDLPFWNNTLTKLKWQIGDVEGVEAKVIGCLKYSFDQLEDKKVQRCFLYCALYPKDSVIREYELIERWIEEEFIAEMDTRQQMKDKGHAILKKLEDNCLLESVERRGGVKMHDAVRDMALSITSMKPRYMVKAGMQLTWFPEEEEWTTDLEKVSLMRNSISKIPIDLSAPKCPLLTTLLLQGNPIKKISNSFFANMPCLSVLNLSHTEIECLPTSFSKLKNLTALLLRCCHRLKHLPSLSKLQRLKTLDLFSSAIEEVPEGMEMLVSLRYLNLDNWELKEVPTGLLPKLSHLQHLRFDPFNGKTSINAEEVVPLEKLEGFFGRFKDTHEFKKFVQSMQCKKSLNAYWLQVGPPGVVSYEESKVVSIVTHESCGDDVLLPIDVQTFHVSNRNLLRSLSDISTFKYANDLRNCRIRNCQGMEFVLSFSSSSTSCTPFQRLESLMLRDLPRLSELIRTEGFTSGSPILAPPGIFSHLNYISISGCSNIRQLFPHWLLTNLQNLEVILVDHCEQLVEIFAVATSEDDDEEKGSDKIKVNLPKLRKLVLKSLQKLKSICSKSGVMEDDDEERGSDKIKVNLPKLRRLELRGLPKLKSICSKSGVMVCDSLERIFVRSCPKLKRIPPFVSLLGNEQPYAYAPPSLTIRSPREWWNSLEWPHRNFKNVLSFRVGYN